jgi:hypothetical protein
MRYQDFQEMEYSLSAETLIATPDGFVTIGALAERCSKDPGHKFIVYSFDHEKRQIVPAFGKQARQTCVDHAWKITFEGGKSITASPEHRLMLRDGTYKKVEDLQVGDSMMPFYRKDLFADAKEGTKGYSWIYTMNPETKGWTKEHHLISSWVEGRPLATGEVVHHINFIKTDNRPENLRIMTESDHNSLHASINNSSKWSGENRAWIESFKARHSEWMLQNAPTRRRDITFSKILQVCERVGFQISKAAHVLDITPALINERLVANGFKSFTHFSDAYLQNQICSTHSAGRMTRDLSIEEIKTQIEECDTKRSLAIKLNCSVNVLDKFLDRRVNIGWRALRESLGFKNTPAEHRTGGRPRGRSLKGATFQQICDSFSPDLTLPRLAQKIGVSKNIVISRLRQNGFKKYSDFKSSYGNHKIASIEYIGQIPLFDLTVDGYKNFATDTVISHNTPEIAAALDIYADETCAQDEKGRVLHIYSDNEKIKEILEDLFYNTLNTEFNLRSWARSLVKFGDFFLYNDVHPDYGVTAAFPIPVNEIEREENYDPTDPMAVRYKWVTLGNKTLENWEVTHFRLLGNDMFLPYGSSVIEPARRIWRQLILIEDAMLVYRVVRAPERRVFYIDVANIPAAEIPMYVEEQRKNLRSNQVIDRNTGRVDLRYNPMSVDEDFIIPVRGTDSGTRIETLAGGQNTAAVEDVAYIQKKLFAALKIPRAYLGYDEMLSSKATLAQEDIRFSRTINVIQKVLLAELNKLAIIHLYANGYDGDDLQNFVLRLSNPSTIAQQQKLELWRAKFEIAGSAPDGFVNKNFVRKEIWGLNDEECKRMDDGRLKDKLIDQSIETASTGGEGGGGGDEGGGDDLFGGGDEGGGDLFGGDEGGDSGPGEENAAAQPTPSKLITSAHDPEDDFLDIEDFEKKLGGKTPIVPSPKVKSESKKRKVKKRKGRITTHLPDFAEMVKPETDYTDKYFFSDPFRNLGNPLAEKVRIPLSHDVVSTLKNWSKRYGVKGNNLLSEGQNVEDDDLFILDEEG